MSLEEWDGLGRGMAVGGAADVREEREVDASDLSDRAVLRSEAERIM